MRSTITILPADTYTVVNKTVLSENDHKLITMLYQPVIGHTATSLYFTLIDESPKFENVGALSDPIFRYSLKFIVRVLLSSHLPRFLYQESPHIYMPERLRPPESPVTQ